MCTSAPIFRACVTIIYALDYINMLIQIFTTGLEDKEEIVWLQGLSFILTILFNVHVLFKFKTDETPLQERTYSYVGLLPVCWCLKNSSPTYLELNDPDENNQTAVLTRKEWWFWQWYALIYALHWGVFIFQTVSGDFPFIMLIVGSLYSTLYYSLLLTYSSYGPKEGRASNTVDLLLRRCSSPESDKILDHKAEVNFENRTQV